MTHQSLTMTTERAQFFTRERIVELLAQPAPPPDPQDLPPVKRDVGARALDAAVLVPLVHRPDGVRVLLTQRTPHLEHHGGQISFPGGRVEDVDSNREDTALRETEEEIGLARGAVRLLGNLPLYENLSGFRITPVVGWIEPPFELKLDPFEVAEAFEAPLAHFLDRANYQRREFHYQGRHRRYMAVPYEGRYIWGATAAMLHCLSRVLRY
jgi:8-oxo-dGTP pyrophosphatase MutT (NUDIX family)